MIITSISEPTPMGIEYIQVKADSKPIGMITRQHGLYTASGHKKPVKTEAEAIKQLLKRQIRQYSGMVKTLELELQAVRETGG